MKLIWRSRTHPCWLYKQRPKCHFFTAVKASTISNLSRQNSTTASVTAMQKSNRLRVAFKDKKGPSFGIWQMLPGTNVSRALARANPDWIMVDCEHGNIDDAAMHELIPAIAACGVSPIVRIPDLQSWMIKRKLPVVASKLISHTELCTRSTGRRCAWGKRSPVACPKQVDEAD